MKPGFLLSVFGIMLGLLFIDKLLASIERRELITEAASLYRQGEELMAKGQAPAAIGLLRRSVTMARENRAYRLALANALLAVGRLDEARSDLEYLLELDSNAGSANLAMARLQAQLGNSRETEAYYHRAIYGTWPSAHQTIGIRVELAEFLAQKGEDRQLLSELLLLQGSSTDDRAVQLTIANLFLKAGSPTRAAQTYRSLLRRYPNDVEAYSGLAESELLSGEYGMAMSNLRRALHRSPGDSRLVERLELATNLSTLDPTPRRLTSREKYRRSLAVLELAKTAAAGCAKQPSAQPEIEPLLATATRPLNVRRSVTNELSESLLDAATALWEAKTRLCGVSDSSSRDPLPVLMHKIANNDPALDPVDLRTGKPPDANSGIK